MSEGDALYAFWQDPQPDRSFRLSFAGFEALRHICVDHYKFDVSPPAIITKPSLLLTLSRKLTSPYFIGVGKSPYIVFFGSKEATLYSLYGDLNKFVQALAHY